MKKAPITLILLILSVQAFSQEYVRDFWIPDQRVWAMEFDNDYVYLGGRFEYVGPQTGCMAMVDPATGHSSYVADAHLTGTAWDMEPDGFGGWFLSGSGFASPETGALGNIVHVWADGTIDTTWNHAFNSTVYDMVRVGKWLYFSGNFTTIDAASHVYLGRIDTASRAVDAGWSPPVPDASVLKIFWEDSLLYIAGNFDMLNASTFHQVARMDTNGLVEIAWNPNPGGGSVVDLAFTDKWVYIGGTYTGIGSSPTIKHLSRVLKSNGNVDLTYMPQPSGSVYKLYLSDSSLYAGGSFGFIGGESHEKCTRLDTLTGVANPNWDASVDVRARAFWSDGTHIYIGGQFREMAGRKKFYMGRVDLATSKMDTTWSAHANSIVEDFNIVGGQIVVNGFFASLGGTLKDNYARLDLSSGEVDTTWGGDADSWITALYVEDNYVYLGGPVTDIGGTAVNRCARIFKSDASVDTDFDPRIGSSFIYDIERDGRWVYIGGSFTIVGGGPVSGIIRADTSNGFRDGSWEPSPNGQVKSIHLQDTAVLIGGTFTSVAGVARAGFARLSKNDDIVDLTFDLDVDGEVNDILEKDGKVFAAGDFRTMGGDSLERIARIDTLSWMTDTGFNPGATDKVNDLFLDGDRLYFAGYFDTLGGEIIPGFARMNADSGVTDTSMDLNLPWYHHGEKIKTRDGRLFVAGEYEDLGPIKYYNFSVFDLNDCVSTYRLDSVPLCWGDSIFVGGAYQTLAGNYFDTIPIGGGCDSVIETLLFLQVPPNAGTDHTDTICSDDAAFDLFPLLGGSPSVGGSWFDPDSTEALSGSTFDPSVADTGLNRFIYVVPGASPCENDTAEVLLDLDICIGMEEAPGAWINVVPNPARDEVLIYLDKPIHGGHFSLFDLNGRRIQKYDRMLSGEEKVKLNLAGLPRGIYILEIRETGSVAQAKLLLMD